MSDKCRFYGLPCGVCSFCVEASLRAEVASLRAALESLLDCMTATPRMDGTFSGVRVSGAGQHRAAAAYKAAHAALAGRGPEARGKAIRRDRCLACLTQGRYGELVCEEPDAPPSPDVRGDDDESEVVVERGPRTRLSMERLRGLLEAVDAVLKYANAHGVAYEVPRTRALDALAAKRKEWPP